MRSIRFRPLAFVVLLAAAAAWKAWILLQDAVPFNGDEAIVGLMARHILTGNEQPIFFYGQAYMGSLDAYLVAVGFALFGQQIWVIRLVQIVLYLAALFSTAVVGRVFLGSWIVGLIAVGLLAIPPVNVTLYTTASLGGYGEALVIGNLALLCGMGWIRGLDGARWQAILFALAFGGCAGLGLWANGLTLIYTTPIALAVFWILVRKIRSAPRILVGIPVAIAGFFLGSLPWWLYAFQQGFGSLISELLGNNVAVETGSWLSQLGQHLLNLLVLGGSVTFGFRPPWEVRWLGLPLMPFVLLFWLSVLILFITQIKTANYRLERWVLTGVVIAFTGGFLFTSFGIDPSGRYFLPIYWFFALAAGSGLVGLRISRIWKFLAILVVVIYQGWGTYDCVMRNPPGLTTQFYAPTVYDHSAFPELVEFLKREGETRGYSTYWISYPLAFRSQEELIYAPQLPYHLDLRYAEGDDRYPPYSAAVAQSEKAAYIVLHGSSLEAYLHDYFSDADIQWKTQVIGDFSVFYSLSEKITPQQMGLGSVAP